MSTLDIGAGDVHVPAAAAAERSELISAAKRRSLRPNQFGDPQNRKYPIDTPARVRNAAARLEQNKNSMTRPEYVRIRGRIARAARRMGINSVYNEKTPRSPAVAGRGLSVHLSSPDGSRVVVRSALSAVADGAPAYFDQEQGHLLTSVKLDKGEALGGSGSDPEGRVWVNVARVGVWAGHPQGAFRFDASVFDSIVRNFKNSGVRRLQWDFNHASAMPPSSGNIPSVGTPAQGWIYDVKHDGERLYVLTQWLTLARQYIENDQYDSASVVVDWNGVDRVTGKPIGPVLRSVALTNESFLVGLQPLAADSTGNIKGSRGFMALTEVQDTTDSRALSSRFSCHSLMGMLPTLKAIFGLPELATVPQIQGALDNYRSHLDAVDGDGMAEHEGVQLARYSEPLRGLVNAHAGMDWYAILDIIDELIDAYLDHHDMPDFEESHGPLPTAASVVGTTENHMNEQAATAQAENQDAAAQSASETQASSAPQPVAAQPAVTPQAAVDQAHLPSPEVARLTLENADLRAQVAMLESRVSALYSASESNAEQALSARVDAAIETYGQSKGITEAMRPHLLSVLKATPDAFAAMYPPVAAEHRHLLSTMTGGGASNPQSPGSRVPADTAADINDSAANPTAEPGAKTIALSFSDLVDSLKREHKLTHMAAMARAESILNKARTAQ